MKFKYKLRLLIILRRQELETIKIKNVKFRKLDIGVLQLALRSLTFLLVYPRRQSKDTYYG